MFMGVSANNVGVRCVCVLAAEALIKHVSVVIIHLQKNDYIKPRARPFQQLVCYIEYYFVLSISKNMRNAKNVIDVMSFSFSISGFRSYLYGGFQLEEEHARPSDIQKCGVCDCRSWHSGNIKLDGRKNVGPLPQATTSGKTRRAQPSPGYNK
jgi:hypothetical protein